MPFKFKHLIPKAWRKTPTPEPSRPVCTLTPPQRHPTVQKGYTTFYSQHSRNKPSLSITLSAGAYFKLKWMCHHSDVEVGMWGISRPDEPLYIETFQVVSQRSNRVHNQFDDDALTAYDDFWGFQEERPRNEYRLIWAHTHPKGCSATPSGTDENTLTDSTRLGDLHQIIMLILSEDGTISCRFRQTSPIAFEEEIPVYIDWTSVSRVVFSPIDWKDEYDQNVFPQLIGSGMYSNYAGQGSYSGGIPYHLADEEDEEDDPWGILAAEELAEGIKAQIAVQKVERVVAEAAAQEAIAAQSKQQEEEATDASPRGSTGFHGEGQTPGKRGNPRVASRAKRAIAATNVEKDAAGRENAIIHVASTPGGGQSGVALVRERVDTPEDSHQTDEEASLMVGSILDHLSPSEVDVLMSHEDPHVSEGEDSSYELAPLDACDETNWDDDLSDESDPILDSDTPPLLEDGVASECEDDLIIDDYVSWFNPYQGPAEPCLAIDYERGQFLTTPDPALGMELTQTWAWYDEEALIDKFGINSKRLAYIYARLMRIFDSHHRCWWVIMQLLEEGHKTFLKSAILKNLSEEQLEYLLNADYEDDLDLLVRHESQTDAEAEELFQHEGGLYTENSCFQIFECSVTQLQQLYYQLRNTGFLKGEALQKLADFKRLGYVMSSLNLAGADRDVVDNMTDPAWVEQFRCDKPDTENVGEEDAPIIPDEADEEVLEPVLEPVF